MSVEQRRSCGYRKVGATYLIGVGVIADCDRLPYPLKGCPVTGRECPFGGGIKLSRAITRLENPAAAFGDHKNCTEKRDYCSMCKPSSELAFIMVVGEKYYSTPGDFLDEARTMGISKRIKSLPRGFKIGSTVVYLVHKAAIMKIDDSPKQAEMPVVNGDGQGRLIDAPKKKYSPGIFSAFIPKWVEKLVWESELTDELKEQLEKRGITPVPVPDGDEDHAG